MCQDHPGFVRQATSRPFGRYGSMLLLYYIKVNGFLSLSPLVHTGQIFLFFSTVFCLF